VLCSRVEHITSRSINIYYLRLMPLIIRSVRLYVCMSVPRKDAMSFERRENLFITRRTSITSEIVRWKMETDVLIIYRLADGADSAPRDDVRDLVTRDVELNF